MTVRPHRRHRDPRVPPRRSSLETRVTRREMRGERRAGPGSRHPALAALSAARSGRLAEGPPGGPGPRASWETLALCAVWARPRVRSSRREDGGAQDPCGAVSRRRSRVVVAAPSCCRLVARCWHGWGGRRFTPGFHVKSEPTPGAVRAGIIARRRTARVPRLRRGARCGAHRELNRRRCRRACPAAWRGARESRALSVVGMSSGYLTPALSLTD